jgi:hypothetical protein
MPEIMPKAKGDRWQYQAAATATPVFHRVITRSERCVAHVNELWPKFSHL